MRRYFQFFNTHFLLLFTLACSTSAHAKTVIFAWPYNLEDTSDNYHVKLLQRALSYSEDSFKLQQATEQMSQSRVLMEISKQSGLVDVYWSMTSNKREQQLRPIRIPLDRGLIGWRLLLVQKDTLFLSSFRARYNTSMVQLHDWPDLEILEHNGISVHTASDYSAMFTMIENGRADALPRSISEIDREAEDIASKLSIAADVMLYYPAAEYFFVAKENSELAEAIEFGLLQMYQDGSFESLFKQQYGAVLNRLEQQQRKLIKLHNPLLPAATPTEQSDYWQPLPAHYQLINW